MNEAVTTSARRKVNDCFRYLEFHLVPFLRFPPHVLGAQGAVVASVPRIIHAAGVCRRNFLGDPKG